MWCGSRWERKKEGVQIETNKNKNKRKGKEEGMKDRKWKNMAKTIKVTEKEKNEWNGSNKKTVAIETGKIKFTGATSLPLHPLQPSCGHFRELPSLNNVASRITPRLTGVAATNTVLCQQRPSVWYNVYYSVHLFQLRSWWGYSMSWMLATLVSFSWSSYNVFLHLPYLQ